MKQIKKITRINGNDLNDLSEAHSITNDELINEYAYDLATKALKGMLLDGLISREEFNKIDARNRESFSPHLEALMPENP